MNWVGVNSSNLRAVAYDGERAVLGIAFHQGGVYAYSAVPEGEYVSLLRAASKGRYHHRNIRGRYAYRRLA